MTELIVVIAVIGIIMAVSVPTLWTYFRTATLRGAAEELVTVLNGARQLAIRANSTVCVTNDGTRVQYHLSTCGAATWKGTRHRLVREHHALEQPSGPAAPTTSATATSAPPPPRRRRV